MIQAPLGDAPRSEPARVASGPARLLVGVRKRRQLAAVAARLRALGGRPETFETIGALAVTVPSGTAAVAALRSDPRVAYVERDLTLRVAADRFDTVDPLTVDPVSQPAGLKYTWAYDFVRAGEALAAVGGGSERSVSVIDTGLDVNHPEFAGQVARTFDTGSRSATVTDGVGHGTFVTGLIAALDGNGVGGKGVAGTTKVIAVRASIDGSFTVSDLIRGIDFSIRRGADVVNMSLAGRGFTLSHARALEAAFFNDVLPVAASGNNGQNGNPVEFPAAAVGGRRGARGIGLSVAAVKPDGTVAPFSNHNDFVSLAAPGASSGPCQLGVFSTLPSNTGTVWDEPESCSRRFSDPGGRYAYGEGTSFAAPIVSGLAALAWQAEPRLASEQVADVMTRSARGSGWNEFTGHGIVDGLAAVELARRYDVVAPRAHGRAGRRGTRITARVARSPDRTEPGDELAGRVTYGLLLSRDGGRNFTVLARLRRKPFTRRLTFKGRRRHVLVAVACDRNGNCGAKRIGRLRPPR